MLYVRLFEVVARLGISYFLTELRRLRKKQQIFPVADGTQILVGRLLNPPSRFSGSKPVWPAQWCLGHIPQGGQRVVAVIAELRRAGIRPVDEHLGNGRKHAVGAEGAQGTFAGREESGKVVSKRSLILMPPSKYSTAEPTSTGSFSLSFRPHSERFRALYFHFGKMNAARAPRRSQGTSPRL